MNDTTTQNIEDGNTEETKQNDNKPWLFKDGNSGGPGRNKMTEEEKAIKKEEKKAIKEYIKNYEQGLAEALPDIQPVLIEQAKKGNVKAIREIHEVLGTHKRVGGTVIPIQINIGKILDELEDDK